MQTVPESAAAGTSSRLAAVPIENRQRSRSPAASAAGVASSTSSSESPKATRVPAERSDANARTSSKPRSARSSSVTVPTAPVAPTTPSLAMPSFGARVGQLEGLVERADRALDVLARNVERDLDRRRRHELGLDAELSQRPKGACCDAGVALHPSANDADLAERSEEHTSELQSHGQLVCRLLLEKKKCRIRQSHSVIMKKHTNTKLSTDTLI